MRGACKGGRRRILSSALSSCTRLASSGANRPSQRRLAKPNVTSVSWRLSSNDPPVSVLAVAQMHMRAWRTVSCTSALALVAAVLTAMRWQGGGIGRGTMFSLMVAALTVAPTVPVCTSGALSSLLVLESEGDSASVTPLAGKGVGMRVARLRGPPRSSSTRE